MENGEIENVTETTEYSIDEVYNEVSAIHAEFSTMNSTITMLTIILFVWFLLDCFVYRRGWNK